MREEMQKITVEVPKSLLTQIKKYSGKGTAGAIREAIQAYVARKAQMGLLELRGTMKPGNMTLEEMRTLDDDDQVIKAWETHEKGKLT